MQSKYFMLLPRELRESYEERAAIKEFDGGMPRDKAEKEAYFEMIKKECL